ncbi:L-rhamnose mutarotase [Nonomuraea sp. SMC257]|uniref:L-rhamnose mutarotase n=1 Tax=Nonomuraea montanisoli TaxID=2741721 RepID=A0A7Y6M8B9_9ACTN|nr:L-rhamnose mutarotase [Nonomuraea montanisoli]NUW37219.1 L-rhamnose mutarotase [Nonomuraea montanisoli]
MASEGGARRVCFLLKVREDRLDEYRERHRAVWPDMLDALRRAGWGNYSLFLREDGLLVGYLETDDFEAARKRMAGTEVNDRWQAEMAPFFETGRADEAFAPLEEVFHLD